MSNWVFDKIVQAKPIRLAIAKAQQNTPTQPWTVICIADLVQSELGINLDTDDTDFFERLLSHFNNSNKRPDSEAVMTSSVEQYQDILVKLNDGFHDIMQQAQAELGHDMPLNLLALFLSVQIDGVCQRNPEFEEMVVAAMKYQKDKRVQAIN